MKKQTKLVAVSSTATLLAIGASMTSFAAQGWAEGDGTWVYYDRNGDRVTDKWVESGNNWYYLDNDGEIAIDTLIEDSDNYYYVDINGVMTSNQWVAIDNGDASEDDEPEHYWCYFQASGKALKNSGDNIVSKTVNGKKYAFDDEGKMLYDWVSSDSAERTDNTDGDAFKDSVYYFDGEDDGATTVDWLQMDITYDEATSDYEIAPVFNDDEDQNRWFYFKFNGKKVQSDSSDGTKERTINGKRYAFNQYGAMVAEWSLDIAKAISNLGTNSTAAVEKTGNSAQYSKAWGYFNSVEDGARISKGWLKVIAAKYLNEDKYNDNEDAWYYADGGGNLYVSEFRTIKGKKYAFKNDGRMVSGLKFVKEDNMSVKADDDDDYPFDAKDDFIESAQYYNANDYLCYYFGDGEDGAIKTDKTTISINGNSFNFCFEKSGSKRGSGVNGEKNDKYYLAGMLLKAGSDDKYRAIQKVSADDEVETWKKLADVKEVVEVVTPTSDTVTDENVAAARDAASSFNKKADGLKKFYVLPENNLKLINTSGKIIDKKGKSKDGNDYVYVTDNSGVIRVICVED